MYEPTEGRLAALELSVVGLSAAVGRWALGAVGRRALGHPAFGRWAQLSRSWPSGSQLCHLAAVGRPSRSRPSCSRPLRARPLGSQPCCLAAVGLSTVGRCDLDPWGPAVPVRGRRTLGRHLQPCCLSAVGLSVVGLSAVALPVMPLGSCRALNYRVSAIPTSHSRPSRSQPCPSTGASCSSAPRQQSRRTIRGGVNRPASLLR